MRAVLTALALAVFGGAALAQPEPLIEADAPIDAQIQGGAAPASPAATLTPEQRAALESVIREYLLENPEVIEEAIFVLQDRREQQRRELERAAIAALGDDLFHDPRDYSVGPENASIEIVEFFDYNCGYCRRSTGWVRDTLDAHPDDVRFVFKETPIFGDQNPSSGVAARAAAAAALLEPDKYLDFHFALMDASGTIPPSQIRQIAEDVGLNWRRLEREMDSEAVAGLVEANQDLLYQIGASGTPAFIVNGELVQGAHFERLDALVAAALTAGE